MFRITHLIHFVPILAALLLCSLSDLAQAQQATGLGTTGTTTGGTTGGSTTGSQSSTTAQTGTGGTGLTLNQPALTTDITQLAQEMATGFVGTTDPTSNTFMGVTGAGENANNQSRQFTTRTPAQNINQGSQTQPMYRTFGANNVPYRSPHLIGFQVTRPADRSVDLTLRPRVAVLNDRRPQFRNVEFAVTGENTVTLRGSVETERDIKMAMLFVKMEPGVKNVVNELQVSSITPIPLTPPAEPVSGSQE